MIAKSPVLSLLRIGAGIVVFGALGNVANAQSETCGCTIPQVEAGAKVGEVQSAAGSVMTSLASGYGKADAGTPLYAGTRLLTGPDSKASLSFGTSCAIEVPENATVELRPDAEGLCVAMSDEMAASGTNTASVTSSSAAGYPYVTSGGAGAAGGALSPAALGVPAGLFAGAAVGAAVLSGVQAAEDDRSSVSE